MAHKVRPNHCPSNYFNRTHPLSAKQPLWRLARPPTVYFSTFSLFFMLWVNYFNFLHHQLSLWYFKQHVMAHMGNKRRHPQGKRQATISYSSDMLHLLFLLVFYLLFLPLFSGNWIQKCHPPKLLKAPIGLNFSVYPLINVPLGGSWHPDFYLSALPPPYN